VEGLDVIVGGHSHTFLYTPVTAGPIVARGPGVNASNCVAKVRGGTSSDTSAQRQCHTEGKHQCQCQGHCERVSVSVSVSVKAGVSFSVIVSVRMCGQVLPTGRRGLGIMSK
jgi:hypothetical protein